MSKLQTAWSYHVENRDNSLEKIAAETMANIKILADNLGSDRYKNFSVSFEIRADDPKVKE